MKLLEINKFLCALIRLLLCVNSENLTALQAVTHIEYLSLRNGDNIVRPRSSRTQEMDVKIVKAWQLFNDNILDVPHFLACASNFLQSFQREITHNVVIQHNCDQQSNVFGIIFHNYFFHMTKLFIHIYLCIILYFR